MTFKERREQKEFDKNAVVVSFNTTADLEELTDEDLIEMGKFVVGLARDQREREKQGLA